jgi:hypothetical protein
MYFFSIAHQLPDAELHGSLWKFLRNSAASSGFMSNTFGVLSLSLHLIFIYFRITNL